jgi:pyrrolidone-carboxylate peptidase
MGEQSGQRVADVRGEVRRPATIIADGPARLESTLFMSAFDHPFDYGFSENAGTYLCNYIYYRALHELRDKRVGFVHVPPLARLPLDQQCQQISRLLAAIDGPSAAWRSGR